MIRAQEGLRVARDKMESKIGERTLELSREIEEGKRSEKALLEEQRIAAVGSWRWSVEKFQRAAAGMA